MANLKAGTTVGGDAVFTVGNISSYGLNFLNGNVGIGTAAPSKTLTIDGNLLVNKRDVDNGNPTMLLNSGGAADHATLDIYDKDGNDGARITANGDSWLSAKGGNVGIGTTGPLHKLHVAEGNDGAMSVGGSHDIYGLQFSYDQASATESTIRANTDYDNNATLLKISTNNNTNQLVLKGDGNVGIGTTSPTSKLHVYGSARIERNGASPLLQFTDQGSSNRWIGIPDGTQRFSIYANDGTTEHLAIDSGGNVGIGTTDTGSYRLNVNGSTNVQGTLHTDALFLKSSAYEMWHRDYIVRAANPQPILTESGVDIAVGGAYRVTAHIPSTGTHTGASAVFWNSDGVWYVNHTVQPTESSNHIGFYVSGDNKPRIQTWHTADYSISVLHERVFLGESSTENTRYLFGMDGLLSYRSDSRLYLNGYTADGSTTDTTTIASDKGKRILHQTSSYSGWDVYKLSENGLLMANDSAADNIWIGANTTYDSGGFKSLAAGRSSWGYLGGGSGDQVFAVFTDLSTVAGEVIQTANNEMFSVTNTTTYDHGNENVHAGNIESKIPSVLQNKYPCLLNSIGAYLPMVPGGLYATSASSKTGAIKIKIPTKSSNGMQSFFVDIYEYAAGESMTFKIGLYNSTAISRTSVVNLSDNPNRDFNVRFYTDTNEQYLTIGETNSAWSYPQIAIRDFVSGYQTSQAEALTAWSISFVTSTPGTLNATHSNNYPSIDYDQIDNKPSTFTPASHNHNASEITAGTLSSARIPAATDTSLGGVKVSYDTITKTLSITTI